MKSEEEVIKDCIRQFGYGIDKKMVEQIRLDAFKAGMTKATDIANQEHLDGYFTDSNPRTVDDEAYDTAISDVISAIQTARDNLKTLP